MNKETETRLIIVRYWLPFITGIWELILRRAKPISIKSGLYCRQCNPHEKDRAINSSHNTLSNGGYIHHHERKKCAG